MSRFRWIDDAGQEHTLVDVDDLARAIDTGTITGDTLIHDSRIDRWLKASEHDVLRALRRSATAERSRPERAATGPSSNPGAIDASKVQAHLSPAIEGDPRSAQAVATSTHPWRRWFARLTDNYLFATVLGFVTVFVPSVSGIWDNAALANLVTVTLFVPVEAWLLSMFGTTVGKALLGIRLATSGAPLSFAQALRRAGSVYVRGMGLGIPIVTLFTMAHQHAKLTKQGMATYDRDTGITITHTKVPAVRIVTLVVLWIALLALLVYGSLLPE